MALQFLARTALVTQLTIAYILLTEALRPDIRGRVNGLLAAFAQRGRCVAAALLEPSITAGYGWRGLFVIGALPLLVVPWLWRCVRESEAFIAHAARERPCRRSGSNSRACCRTTCAGGSCVSARCGSS